MVLELRSRILGMGFKSGKKVQKIFRCKPRASPRVVCYSILVDRRIGFWYVRLLIVILAFHILLLVRPYAE